MTDILSILVFILLALGGYWLGYSNGHAYGYADGFFLDGVEAFKEELNKDKGD